REALVLAHVDAENRHDVDATVATFGSPRYEVNGQPVDGAEGVRALLDGLFTAFPDLHIEQRAIHHADDAVIAEGRVTATHLGPFGGIEATGRPVDYPIVGIFQFEGDELMCERVHVDTATILTQIGAL
ncbi:MAG TPA: ester cyclase, partial [Acidimicrobiales bacterium]|nr:ester cyclase [Acidimicrobiales bacterium]